MKVLHILNELRPSGAETMLRVAGGCWAAHGLRVQILGTGDVLGAYADALHGAGYELHHLAFQRRPGFALRVWWLCRQFDVVHVHTERANFVYGLVARLGGCRVVRTVHSTFNHSGVRRWVRILERAVLRLIGVQHVAIGASVARVEAAVNRNATTLVPNWFDTAAYAPADPVQRVRARASMGLPVDATVLAVVGNCSAIKNHTALIHAVAALSPAQRENLQVLHVGSGADEANEVALAHSLGVATTLRFIGAQPSAQLALQAADAFVMPSLHEGFSIAALEALGSGLPALFTDVAGLRDLRTVSPAIVWAADPSAAALATALKVLLDDLVPLATVARSRVPAVAQEFGPQAGVARYAALYLEG